MKRNYKFLIIKTIFILMLAFNSINCNILSDDLKSAFIENHIKKILANVFIGFPLSAICVLWIYKKIKKINLEYETKKARLKYIFNKKNGSCSKNDIVGIMNDIDMLSNSKDPKCINRLESFNLILEKHIIDEYLNKNENKK